MYLSNPVLKPFMLVIARSSISLIVHCTNNFFILLVVTLLSNNIWNTKNNKLAVFTILIHGLFEIWLVSQTSKQVMASFFKAWFVFHLLLHHAFAAWQASKMGWSNKPCPRKAVGFKHNPKQTMVCNPTVNHSLTLWFLLAEIKPSLISWACSHVQTNYN